MLAPAGWSAGSSVLSTSEISFVPQSAQKYTVLASLFRMLCVGAVSPTDLLVDDITTRRAMAYRCVLAPMIQVVARVAPLQMSDHRGLTPPRVTALASNTGLPLRHGPREPLPRSAHVLSCGCPPRVSFALWRSRDPAYRVSRRTVARAREEDAQWSDVEIACSLTPARRRRRKAIQAASTAKKDARCHS